MKKQFRPFLAALTVFVAGAITFAAANSAIAPVQDVPTPLVAASQVKDDPQPTCGLDDCLANR